jgi:probable dihydroxyacetone kinase regulator
MSQITKQALAYALKDTLKVKPFNKITISDITTQCGINRMTFYYHFQDIYDLLEYAIISEFDKVLNGNKTVSTWKQGMKNILTSTLENKSFILNAYHSLGKDKIENYLSKVVFDLTYSVVNEESKGMSVYEDDKVFIAKFYEYALIGIVLDWVKSNMNEEPDIILERIDKVLSGETKTALNRFRFDK